MSLIYTSCSTHLFFFWNLQRAGSTIFFLGWSLLSSCVELGESISYVRKKLSKTWVINEDKERPCFFAMVWSSCLTPRSILKLVIEVCLCDRFPGDFRLVTGMAILLRGIVAKIISINKGGHYSRLNSRIYYEQLPFEMVFKTWHCFFTLFFKFLQVSVSLERRQIGSGYSVIPA